MFLQLGVMKVVSLKRRKSAFDFPKADELYMQFNDFVDELNSRSIPENTISAINREIEEINSSTEIGVSMKSLIVKKLTAILKLLEKEHKLVPKNYYRNNNLLKDSVVFGAPTGFVIGLITKNMALISAGMVIAMAISFIRGRIMDKKAFEEGRQFSSELLKTFSW